MPEARSSMRNASVIAAWACFAADQNEIIAHLGSVARIARVANVHWQEFADRGRPPGQVTVSLVASGCAFLYALYRAYYGFGGTIGMFGTPASWAQWRAVNLTGAAVVLMIALVPIAALPLWPRPRVRPVLLALCWLLAVGLVGHALIDDIQRVLSLAGLLQIDYPIFTTVDRRAADIQDLILNETWFLAEGLLLGALAWISLGRSSARNWWIGTALAAIAVLTVIGMLSAFGIIGRFIIG